MDPSTSNPSECVEPRSTFACRLNQNLLPNVLSDLADKFESHLSRNVTSASNRSIFMDRRFPLYPLWLTFSPSPSDHADRRATFDPDHFRRTTLTRVLACNVTLQLTNRLLLPRDNPLHEIADGNHSNDHSIGDHRQVTTTMFCHHGHTFVYSMFLRHMNHRTSHDLSHRSVRGSLSLQDHLSSVIALRHDADESVLGENH